MRHVLVLALAAAGLSACGNDGPKLTDISPLSGTWTIDASGFCTGGTATLHEGADVSAGPWNCGVLGSGTVGGGVYLRDITIHGTTIPAGTTFLVFTPPASTVGGRRITGTALDSLFSIRLYWNYTRPPAVR